MAYKDLLKKGAENVFFFPKAIIHKKKYIYDFLVLKYNYKERKYTSLKTEGLKCFIMSKYEFFEIYYIYIFFYYYYQLKLDC